MGGGEVEWGGCGGSDGVGGSGEGSGEEGAVVDSIAEIIASTKSPTRWSWRSYKTVTIEVIPQQVVQSERSDRRAGRRDRAKGGG